MYNRKHTAANIFIYSHGQRACQYEGHSDEVTLMVSLSMQGSEESAANLAHLTPAMSSSLARAKFFQCMHVCGCICKNQIDNAMIFLGVSAAFN